jgi:hypothetical protein
MKEQDVILFFAYKKKLGTVGSNSNGLSTSAEAIKHTGLDYEVIKSALYQGINIIDPTDNLEIGDNEVNVPNYFATIRTDNNAVLGVVGRVSHKNRDI